MKIGKLNQHCGNCRVIECCGEPFYYCLCSDERFEEITEEIYLKLTENIDSTGFEKHPMCIGCERDCDDCEEESEAKDVLIRFIADKVAGKIMEGVNL